MALTLNIHKLSLTQLIVSCLPAFRSQAAIVFEKNLLFSLFPTASKLPNLTLL